MCDEEAFRGRSKASKKSLTSQNNFKGEIILFDMVRRGVLEAQGTVGNASKLYFDRRNKRFLSKIIFREEASTFTFLG